ncbi:MAG: hypothetical protein V4584_15370 [Verrucomicrobiota bacterium]
MKPWIRKAHRWLGLIFSLTLLMSSGSGVIHTIMTRTQAPPPAARPGSLALDISSMKLTPQDAVARLPGGTEPTAVNLRMIAGQPHYQIFSATGKSGYVNAVTGAVDPSTDEIYAGEIASGFLGGMPVRKSDYLTAFNREYIGIFRILPVYRFDAGDPRGNRVYVSTVTGSVTRHTDDGKQFEADIFTLFHKFGFIRDKDLRDWGLILVTGGTFAVSVLGVVLFFLTRPRRRKP